MRDTLMTVRTRRAQLATVIAAQKTRSAQVQAAIAAIVAGGSLAAIDAATFGFFNNCAATDSVSITATDKTLTSPDAPWIAGDVGKVIHVAGAGAAGAVLVSRIASYTSAGEIELEDAAVTTVAATKTSAGGLAAWGNQATHAVDPAAIQNANGATLQSDISVLVGPAGKVFPAGLYPITDDTTIDLPVTMQTGAAFLVTAGKTLTINGAVYAGNEHIFQGAGSVVGAFGNVPLNPFWFGAVANGNIDTGAGTDDGPAFNRCIAARTPSTTVAHAIHVPPGHFLINTRVNIPSGVSLIGSGPWSTYLVCASAYASDVVRFNGVGGPPSRLTGFSVSAQTGGAAGATGINIATNGTFVDNVWVNGFLLGVVIAEGGDNFLSSFAVEICTTGIYVTGSDCNISHGTVYDCANGIVVGNAASAGIGQVVINAVRATSCAQVGFYVSAGKHVAMSACSAAHVNSDKLSVAGFKVDGASVDVSIMGCQAILGSVSATGFGALVSGSARLVAIDGFKAIGWLDGVRVDSSGDGLVISKVIASGNGRHGISAVWTGPQLSITGCICTYTGSAAAGDSGILVDSSAAYQNLVVSGNVVDQGGGGPMEYGIHISMAVASSKGVCQGNSVMNAATANILIDGAAAANVVTTGANV